MNGDVCADFPLEELLSAHIGQERAVATVLGTEVTCHTTALLYCFCGERVIS